MHRDLVVIGGSAGALAALTTILKGLPEDFAAAIVVVVHIPTDFPSILPDILTRCGPLAASHPRDGAEMEIGHVYVAPPDYHTLIEGGKLRLSRGPRENRHRPAVDPLFRSAAREYTDRLVGVIVSGQLDDGALGLAAVKTHGGMAMAQDPLDAECGDMPRNAIDLAAPQFIGPASAMSAALVKMVGGQSPHRGSKHMQPPSPPQPPLTPQDDLEHPIHPSRFACPECHGVLWETANGNSPRRFRCRIGHAFGVDSLVEEFDASAENALWAAMRLMRERADLAANIAPDPANPRQAAARRAEAEEAERNAETLRQMIVSLNQSRSPQNHTDR